MDIQKLLAPSIQIEQYGCKSCMHASNSKSSLETHTRITHQTCKRITIEDKVYTFRREEDGNFGCKCGIRGGNPRFLEKHKRCYEGERDMERDMERDIPSNGGNSRQAWEDELEAIFAGSAEAFDELALVNKIG